MQNNPLLHITSINVQTKVGYLWLPSQVTHHRPLAALSTQSTVQASLGGGAKVPGTYL